MPFIPDDENFIADSFTPEDPAIARKARISFLQGEKTRLEKDANRSLGSRFLEALPGAAVDVAVKTPLREAARFTVSAAEAPGTIKRGIQELRKPGSGGQVAANKTYSLPGIGKFQSFISEAGDMQEKIIAGEEPLYKGLKPFVQVPLAGLTTAGLLKGGIGDVGLTAGKGLTGRAAPAFGQVEKGLLLKGGASVFARRAAAREAKLVKEATKIVEPKLTQKEQDLAFAAGRGRIVKGKVEVTPGEKEIEQIEVLKPLIQRGVVRRKNNPFKNIANINKEVNKLANVTDDALEKNGISFDRKDLVTRLGAAKEESRVLFGTDKTQESAYNTVIDEYLKHLSKQKQDVSGLLHARREFDGFMRSRFGSDILNPAKAGDKVRSNAVLDVRRAVNEYISEILPEGNPYKELLKQQSTLINVVKTLSHKAPRAGTITGIRRVFRGGLKALPYAAGALGGGGAAVAGTRILTRD